MTKNFRKISFALVLASIWLSIEAVANLTDRASKEQETYERENQTVLRNKIYYKAGKLEIGLVGGTMPYDSLMSHFMAGGRVTWHIADHYGWEVIDAQVGFPSVTSFTTDLVRANGIFDLESPKIKFIATSNFVFSPVYGKIRFFGKQVLHFDAYLVGGGGLTKVDTARYSSNQKGEAGVETITLSAMDPTLTLGFGFKLFYNDLLGMSLDFRDYVIYTDLYGGKRVQSNFAVYLGLSFFLPSFG